MSTETPVAVVMYASQSRQQIAKGTLTDIHLEVERQKLHAPALIVVGEVVNLQEILAFSASHIALNQVVV
jgi:uroporphyrin-III C-methyltransferase